MIATYASRLRALVDRHWHVLILTRFRKYERDTSVGLLDVLAKSLLLSVNDAVEARVIALNASTGTVINAVWLKRSPGSVGEPIEVEGHALQAGSRPDPGLPWFENAGASSGLRFDGLPSTILPSVSLSFRLVFLPVHDTLLLISVSLYPSFYLYSRLEGLFSE